MRKWGDRVILDIDCNSSVDFMLPGGNLQGPSARSSSQKLAANPLQFKVELPLPSQNLHKANGNRDRTGRLSSAIMNGSLFSARFRGHAGTSLPWIA
jgi:hypothetical protein